MKSKTLYDGGCRFVIKYTYGHHCYMVFCRTMEEILEYRDTLEKSHEKKEQWARKIDHTIEEVYR